MRRLANVIDETGDVTEVPPGCGSESERLLDTATRTKGDVNIGKACIARNVSRALIDRGWTPGGDGEAVVVSVGWPRRGAGNMVGSSGELGTWMPSEA